MPPKAPRKTTHNRASTQPAPKQDAPVRRAAGQKAPLPGHTPEPAPAEGTPAQASGRRTAKPASTPRARKPAPGTTAKPRAKAASPKAQTAPQTALRDMTKAEVQQFLTDLSRAWPDAQTELHYTTPFTLLVAVVLSAQATDASVNRVTPALFAAAPTPQAMAALGDEQVGQLIRTIGLWRNKAKNVVELSRQLLAEHDGQIPHTREALEKLAGVGRKTANVVLNVAFNQPTVPVDTHVFRLANRSGLGRGRTVEAVEKKLEARIPLPMVRDSHHWLILQGRYVCKARKPECWRCAAQQSCLFPDKTPLPRPKTPRAAPSITRKPHLHG